MKSLTYRYRLYQRLRQNHKNDVTNRILRLFLTKKTLTRLLYPRGNAEISHYKTNRKSGKHCNYANNLDESMKITKSMKGLVLYNLAYSGYTCEELDDNVCVL